MSSGQRKDLSETISQGKCGDRCEKREFGELFHDGCWKGLKGDFFFLICIGGKIVQCGFSFNELLLQEIISACSGGGHLSGRSHRGRRRYDCRSAGKIGGYDNRLSRQMKIDISSRDDEKESKSGHHDLVSDEGKQTESFGLCIYLLHDPCFYPFRDLLGGKILFFDHGRE